MRQKNFLRFFIAMLGLLMSSTAYSYSFVSEGIYYNILSDQTSVEVTYRNTNYDTYIGEIIIPSEVSYNGNTYTVTGIGSKAFCECSTVTSITLPPTISKIGLYAFLDANHIQKVNISNLTSWCMMDVDSYYSCPLVYGGTLYLDNSPVSSLESLDPSCTTIAKYAFFGNTYLTNVVLPESIKSVQAAAFRGCSNITFLEVGPNVTSMGEGAFRSCSSLKTIKFCNSDQQLMLGWYESGRIYKYFKDCPLTTVYIGRDINWADDSYNYEKYYPFTTVKTAVFNGAKASDSGFSNLLTTAYVGTDCKELSFSSKNLSNLFVFTNDITRAYLGSTMANVYVIDRFNIPTKISELTCQSINNLIEIQNLLNGASYTYGNTPTIDSNNFVNNVVDMSLNISASSLDTSVGFYDFGISLTLSNNLWDVNFNVPYSYSVTPAPLTVIANDASRKYGTENPEFTCSFFGFKNNETQDVLTKQPTIETTATITSNVGSYPIIPYGAEARNYTFTYERGLLNITKANQEIVWSQVFDDVHVGDIIELTAESSSGLDIKYTSTDETIAEIFTQSGKKYVEFLKTGNVSIRANQAGNENYNEADRVSKSIEVKAKSILVSSLTFDCTEWNGYEDSNFQINATILPENATNKALQWSSSDEDVATVDNDGFVTILAPGDCIISAKTLDGSNLSADCSIKAVSGINMIEFDENAMFDVYNSNGIMIKKSASNETLNSLSPGLYIIIQNGIAHKIMIK